MEGGTALVCGGAMTEGSVAGADWELPGTTAGGEMGGNVPGVTELPAPEGGLTTVVVAARSDKGEQKKARPIRQMPKQRKDSM